MRRVVVLAIADDSGGRGEQKANAFICRRCGYVEMYAILWED
jgi:hypothetical protein